MPSESSERTATVRWAIAGGEREPASHREIVILIAVPRDSLNSTSPHILSRHDSSRCGGLWRVLPRPRTRSTHIISKEQNWALLPTVKRRTDASGPGEPTVRKIKAQFDVRGVVTGPGVIAWYVRLSARGVL
jgi:hypothetical protein